MNQQMENIFRETMDLIEQYGSCLLENSNYNTESEIQELLPIVEDIYDLKERYLAGQSVFRDYMSEFENASEDINVNDAIEDYKNRIEEALNLVQREENKAYKEFKYLLLNRSAKPLDDSEIATVSEAVNTLDPITKLPLTEPVKNVKCGHTYEKSSILHMLKSKKKVKCPIPGCIAAKFVEVADLVPDTAMKRLLEANKKT